MLDGAGGDREQFHYKDAPAVIQRLFGFTVRDETIYRWIYKGRTLKSSGQSGYLPTHTMADGARAYNSMTNGARDSRWKMPNTPCTTYCNHVYQLTQDVRKFIVEGVAPAIDAQCKDNPAADPRHYRVLLYPFTRITRWLITFERLNNSHDMQAIGTGARCIFEHYLDLRWLQKFPDETWFVRFREFPDVDRYMAAKRVVDHRTANPASQIDIAPHQAFMRRMDTTEPMATRVLRTWGADSKGNPRWPRDHWTGEGNLRERAKKIAPECEDGYVQIYPTLCALVHPGPTPAHGDFTWLEKQVAFGYFYAFLYARNATEVTCDIFGIKSPVLRNEYNLQRLDQWAAEAMSKLPKDSTP